MVQSTLARVGSHWKPIAIVAAGALIISGGVVAVAESRSKDAGREALADASRVLQSVNVKLAPNGDLTGIKGNVVGTTTADKAFSFSDDYQPDSSAKDLPVRVLTSYRTAKKSGTDLSELDGYDGRVDITVTVQNLTVKPKQVTYDVDGEQRAQSALVGVPLTVVGSTSLAGTKPSAVVTKGAKKGTVTNGVLSQDQDGNTQVQWATILAPPQLASSTTMTLSVDAKDFKVPAFDLSVQPGLVTDPSMSALLNSAFNPAGNSQMQLEQRTIALIAELNTVLAKAGKSMATVRKTLGDSSKTLGTKTVSDLQQSTESIASSVKGLKGSVTQLGGDISGSLKSTQSQTLSELNGLVSSVNGLLGDTSAQPPAVTVTPNPDPSVKCDVKVDVAEGSPSIYGNLLKVVALLNGYSQATSFCKADVQEVLMNVIGPSYDELTDDPKLCDDVRFSVSATCALLKVRNSLTTYADSLQASEKRALDTLDGLGIDSLVDAVRGTPAPTEQDPQARVNGLVQAADALEKAAEDSTGTGTSTDGLKTALGLADQAYSGIEAAINALHGAAIAGQSNATRLLDTNNSLAELVCRSDSGFSETQANQVRRYTSTTFCDTTTIVGNDPMGPRLTTNKSQWDEVVAQTDTAASSPGSLVQSLKSLRSSLDSINTEILKIDQNQGDNAVRDAADVLTARVGDVVSKANTLDTQIGDEGSNSGAYAEIKNTFDAAIAGLRDTPPKPGDPTPFERQIRLVYARGEANSKALGLLFDKSSKSLIDAGSAIQADGKKTVEQSKGAFASQKNESAARISAAISAGLSQVDKGVNASTRDLEGAQTLLINDLRNVLLDLGTRKVKGSGLLGAMATSAATTGSANYQVALASRTASAYSNVRQSDIVGLLLRQAQTDAAEQAQANLPAFRLDLPSSADHETVYSFHLDSEG